MADLTVSKGDYGLPLAFVVKDEENTVVNLTGYTVTFKVWSAGSQDSPIVSGACTIDDATAGTCHYTPGSSDFDTAGDYLIELERTKTGVKSGTTIYSLTVEESA